MKTIALAALLMVQVPGNQAPGVGGFFKIELQPPAGALLTVGYIYVEAMDANTLKITDLATGKQITGRVDGSSLESPYGSKGQMAKFSGSLGRDKWTAYTSEAGEPPAQVAIVRLSQLWQCNNHSPAHLTDTDAGKTELEKKNKCTEWKRVAPPK